MQGQTDYTEGYFRRRNVENLLLMAVLGEASMREKARAELQRRRIVNSGDDFEDSFMTNLSVV